MMAAQASKIKSFDAAIEEEPKSQLKTSLSMSNILQHQQEHARLVKKKMKKKKKAASKNNKKAKKSKESLIKPAAVETKLEACISTEEIETAYHAADPAAHSQPRGRERGLSRSSPSPTSSTRRLGPAHGGAWSDADDEILEFVREETPLDRRSVGPVSVGSGSVVVATSTTTTTSTTASPALPSKKGKAKSKKKKQQQQQQLHNKNTTTNGGGGGGGCKKNGSSSTSASASSGSGSGSSNNMAGTSTPRSQDDELRCWDAREAADEEDEEEAFDKEEEAEEEDTDEESGSCSSRYGWQFKNDKLIAGRDWAEFYDNMKRHIGGGAPRREFAMLDEDAARVYAKRTDDFSCAVAPLNFQKNRYGNILPYNQNRVKLAVADDQSDYVNASYVKLDDVLPGFQDKITYIAASAPIPSTVEDFYRMLWETETFGIVMLTRNEEGGRPKCHQYWPEDNDKQTYGCFTVTNVEEIDNKKHSFLVRRFVVEKAGETREITQYHYLAWPDHGVPESSEPLEEIIKLINERMREVGKTNALKEPTLVAHCSAGIGRTGAFILIHTILNLLFQEIKEGDAESLARWTSKAPPTIDFVHLVQHMRNQRTCMISQPEQYEFCYQTVLSNLGRALQYTPRKCESGSPSPKHVDGRVGRKTSLGAIPRQKSCVLF